MTRNRFENQLHQLNNEIIRMGTMIEEAIEAAIDAFVHQDVRKAQSIIRGDDEINQCEKDIESLCMRLLLEQQPVARDLRQISSALKMITDMERIGDHASDISEMTILMSSTKYAGGVDHLQAMACETMKMLHESVDAFVRRDLSLAATVIESDDKVDDLFLQVKEEIIDVIIAQKKNGEEAIDLLMVAKYFERIGDHATNIAEWVVYSITGNHDAEVTE